MDASRHLIRVAGSADAGALARLRYRWRVFEGTEEGLDEPAFEVALRAWMEEHVATHVPFLAIDGDEPIAMAWLALVERIPGPGRFVRRSAYVQSVYVVESRRSSGVGTSLMEFVLEHARGLNLDYVAVHPSERSFPFYRRLGFSDADRVLELRGKRLPATSPGVP